MATTVEQPQSPSARGTVAPGPTRSRRRIIIPILVVVALVALGWFGKRLMYGRTHATTDNSQVDGHIVPVLAKVGGYVSSVTVDENDHVRQGAVVTQIDDAEYRVRFAQAEAELAAAQAAVSGEGATGQAQAALQAASSQQAAQTAQVTAARANYDRAASDLARMRDLAAKQIVSQQQLDAARAAAGAARANLDAVGGQAAAAGASVVNARAGIRLAQARLQAARAARDNAALQLSYTRITAPESGTVTRKQVEVGQLVQPGQPLMSIVADTGVWVTANYKETQLATIRPGEAVELEVDAYGGCKAEGKVESISSATGARFALLPPDNATGNFTKVVQRVPVRIAVTKGCGAGRPLRPGMSVVAHVETK